MSYSERDGQVVLTMSREDWDAMLIRLGIAAHWMMAHGGTWKRELDLLNRLNSGNPNYTPYQVEGKKC
jgi:hypothetical protein